MDKNCARFCRILGSSSAKRTVAARLISSTFPTEESSSQYSKHQCGRCVPRVFGSTTVLVAAEPERTFSWLKTATGPATVQLPRQLRGGNDAKGGKRSQRLRLWWSLPLIGSRCVGRAARLVVTIT